MATDLKPWEIDWLKWEQAIRGIEELRIHIEAPDQIRQEESSAEDEAISIDL